MRSKSSHRFFFRVLALSLGMAVTLSSPAFALRQEPPAETGLEEKLREKLSGRRNRLGEKWTLASVEEIPGLRDRLEEANRLRDYSGHFVKKGGRYYLVKHEEESPPPKPGEQPRSIWETINSPVREHIASLLLEALGCSICAMEIPSREDREKLSRLTGLPSERLYLVPLSTNDSLDDLTPEQMDSRKEFTRRILAAFWIRFFDFRKQNIGPLKDSKEHTKVFDAEQSFHPYMGNLEHFIWNFSRNHFEELYGVDLTAATRRAGAASHRIDPLPFIQNLDLGELKRMVRTISGLDVDPYEREAKQTLLNRYGDPDGTMEREIEEIFGNLRRWQGTFSKDAGQIILDLAEGFVDPIRKRELVVMVGGYPDASTYKEDHQELNAMLRRQRGRFASFQKKVAAVRKTFQELRLESVPAVFAAGMEETQQIEAQARSALKAIWQSAAEELGIRNGEHERDLLQHEMGRFMCALLDHPNPSLVIDTMRGFLNKIDAEVLPLLERIDPQVWVLPKADDWLAYQIMYPEDSEVLMKESQALVVYSPRGSALAFGRLGPHLRADFVPQDLYIDIGTAPALMRGFLPQLDGLLTEVEELRKKGHSSEALEKEAREYAGALFNGLMFPAIHLDRFDEYVKYFDGFMEYLKAHGIARPEAILSRVARLFPERFPAGKDRLPQFLQFRHAIFTSSEVPAIESFNAQQSTNKRISLWDLTVGNPSANGYIQKYDQIQEAPKKLEFLKKVYAFLLERGTVAGLEEVAGQSQGRVVVVDAALVEQSAVLEEFLRRIGGLAPSPYPDRVIVLGLFADLSGRIQTVHTEQELDVLLSALEERIPSLSLTYVGLEERVPHLQAILRGHPTMTFRAPLVQGANLFALLAAGLGLPEKLAGELGTGLEEAEVRAQAA